MAAGKKRTGSILILLAIVLIIILAGAAFLLKDRLFSAFIPQQQNPVATPPPVQTVDIVVLEQTIALGEQITPLIVSLKPIPQDSFTEGLYFTKIEDVIGKRARYPLQSGIPLTVGLLSDQDPGSYIGSQIPAGYVAISIPITPLSSVSLALRPGDHVNVIASLLLVDLDDEWQTKLPNVSVPVIQPSPLCTSEECGLLTSLKVSGIETTTFGRSVYDPAYDLNFFVVPGESQRPRLVSQTLIQDAIILLIGKSSSVSDQSIADTQATPTPLPEGETAPVEVVQEPDQITVMVSPQDAITLNYLVLSGATLNLVMRSPADNNVRIQTEAVTLQFIMDQYRIPLPAKLNYGLEPRKDEIGFPTAVPSPTPRP